MGTKLVGSERPDVSQEFGQGFDDRVDLGDLSAEETRMEVVKLPKGLQPGPSQRCSELLPRKPNLHFEKSLFLLTDNQVMDFEKVCFASTKEDNLATP